MIALLFSNRNNMIVSSQIKNQISQKKIYLNKFSSKLSMNLKKKKSSVFILKELAGSLLLLTPFLVNALPEVKPEKLIIDDSGILTKSSLSFLEKNKFLPFM